MTNTGRKILPHDAASPDPRPGNYYVSATDGPRTHFLLGPFPTHREALGWVAATREFANKHQPESCFFAFGTARAPDDYTRPGTANEYLLPAQSTQQAIPNDARPNCGGRLQGDGYTTAIHCENIEDDDAYRFHEPDSRPVFCSP